MTVVILQRLVFLGILLVVIAFAGYSFTHQEALLKSSANISKQEQEETKLESEEVSQKPFEGVIVINGSFDYKEVEVKVGSKVVWVNEDNINHTVTSLEGRELNSDFIAPGSSFEHTFENQGIFEYRCLLTSQYAKITVTE